VHGRWRTNLSIEVLREIEAHFGNLLAKTRIRNNVSSPRRRASAARSSSTRRNRTAPATTKRSPEVLLALGTPAPRARAAAATEARRPRWPRPGDGRDHGSSGTAAERPPAVAATDVPGAAAPGFEAGA